MTGEIYFTEKEKNVVKRFKNLKSKPLLPVSRILAMLGITADILSYIGFFVLIGFCLLVTKAPEYAFLFLLAHVLIDAFDGALARFTNKDSESGAFTDTMCGHTGIVIVVAALVFARLINPLLGVIYVYIYTVLMTFVVIRNKLKVPAKFVVRTKYYLYLLYGLWAFFRLDYFNIGVTVFIIAMLPSLFSGYFAIKRALRKIKKA